MDITKLVMVALVVIAAFAAGALAGMNVKVASSGTPQDLMVNSLSDNIPYELRFFGMSDNNTTVIAMRNSTFVVLLDENTTTGYRWNASCTDGLKIVGDNYIPSDTALIGSGGIRAYTVEIIKNGTQSFSAVNARSWENGSAGEFILNIHAHNADEDSI